MRTVTLRKDGKNVDLFDVPIVISVKTFILRNEDEDSFYVTFFVLQDNNKYVYLTIIEPSSTEGRKEKRIVKIEGTGLEMKTETLSNATISYVLKNTYLDEDLVLFLLLDRLNLLDHEITEVDDIIFFE